MRLNKISKAIINAQDKVQLPKNVLITTAFLSMLATPVFAQDAAEAEQEKIKDVEVITVHGGLRGTMTKSLNLKKNTAAITDGISAADFGELPGLSLSDVIENITSVSGHRGKGSTSEMSIRGMGPFLGNATFNGNTITSGGYSRAVNFKKFPSELVSEVNVYKTQQANLVEGGVAGTIDVSSLRPIDHGKDGASIELAGIYNEYDSHIDGNDGMGNRITLSLVKQFETDNFGDFGFTIGMQRSDSSNPEESMLTSSTMYSCATRLADGTPVSGTTGDCEDNKNGTNTNVDRENIGDYDEDSIYFTPSSFTYRTLEDKDERNSIVSAFQWQPNERWDLNFDIEYSKNNYSEDRNDFIVTSARYNLTDQVIADDGTLLYREGQSKMEAQGLYRDEEETYNGYGFSADYDFNDDITITSKVSYSKTERHRIDYKSRVVTGDYWDYSLDNRDHRLTELKFLDANGLSIDDAGYDASTAFDPTDPMSWSAEANDGSGPKGRYERLQDHRINHVWAVETGANWVLDNSVISSVDFGVRYSVQDLYSDLDDDVAIDPNTGAQSPEYTTEDTAETDPLLANCFSDFNNSDWLSSESGDGFQGGEFARFDGRCGYGQLSQINEDGSFTDGGAWEDTRSTGDVNVEEKVLALYAMLNIDTELFGLPVTGNVGVRVVQTDIESKGYQSGYNTTVSEDGYYDLVANNELDTVIIKNDTTNVLPSANITFHYSPEFLIRTAAYVAMSRPQLLDMSAGRTITTDDQEDATDLADLINEVDGGNPNLEPIESKNIDVSFEWYPSMDTAVSVAFYGKQFQASFQSTTLEEMLEIDGQGVAVDVVTNTYTDDKAYLRGVEITGQHHFSELPEPWNGLGVKGSYNYASNSFENEDGAFGDVYDTDGNKTAEGYIDSAGLFGFSKNVFSGSIYWEGEKTTLRLLYKTRSKYFQPNTGSAANRYVEPYEYLDFNAKYKLTSSTSISLKVLNLLDEAQYMTRSTNATPTLISASGTKYQLSIKSKF